MDKKIVLKMEQSKKIIISLEGGGSITISEEQRIVKADEIYRLINFSRGDKIIVESVNEKNIDVPVLKFFEDLISDIAKRLNNIPDSDEDEILLEKEPE